MTYGAEKDTGLFKGRFEMLPMMYKADITNTWSRFPEADMDAKIQLGREGDMFSTMLDMTYGAEKDTGLFKARFEMLPMINRVVLINKWNRFPEMDIESLFMFGYNGEMLSTVLDMTYGMEKHSGSFNGNIEMLPEMIKSRISNNWTNIPEISIESNMEFGRKADSLLAFVEATYGAEKNSASFRGQMDMLPRGYEWRLIQKSSQLPEYNMDAKMELNLKENLGFSTVVKMTYGIEENTGAFAGHFELLPTMMKTGVTNVWSAFPQTNLDAKIELERQGDILSALFDMTYGLEKEKASVNGRIEMLPMLYKTEWTVRSSQFPLIDLDAAYKFGRMENTLLYTANLIYGLEKHTVACDGRINMLPMMYRVNLSHKSSQFPITDMEAKFDFGREGNMFTGVFDLTYGLEKDTAHFEGHLEMLPMMYRAGVSHACSRFPETNMAANIELGREEDMFSTMFDMTYGMEKHTVLFKGYFEMLPMMFRAGMTNIWSQYPNMYIDAKFELTNEADALLTGLDMTYGAEKHVVSMKGHFNKLPMIWKNNVTYMSSRFPMASFETHFDFGFEEEAYFTRFDLMYGLEKQRLTFNGRFAMLPGDFLSEMVYTSTQFPEWNMDAKYSMKYEPTAVTNTFIFTHGPEYDQDINRFFVSHYYKLAGEMMQDFVAESQLER